MHISASPRLRCLKIDMVKHVALVAVLWELAMLSKPHFVREECVCDWKKYRSSPTGLFLSSSTIYDKERNTMTFYDCYRMWNMAYRAKVKHFYVVLYFLYSKNKNPSISCKILQLRTLYTNPRRNSIVSSYVEVPWLKKGRTAIVGWRLIFVFQVH